MTGAPLIRLSISVLGLPSAADAHGAGARDASGWWRDWEWDPFIVAMLFFLAATGLIYLAAGLTLFALWIRRARLPLTLRPLSPSCASSS